MNYLTKEQAKELNEILVSHKILNPDEAEALVYGLSEIAESIDTVYLKIVPQILSEKNHDDLQEKVWDLREEFRHIQYHINDGKLTEL
jgi:hypothetical protein